MLIDLHLHVLPHSTDSFLSLEGAVLKAKERGLDAICVTDHDSMGLRERAAADTLAVMQETARAAPARAAAATSKEYRRSPTRA